LPYSALLPRVVHRSAFRRALSCVALVGGLSTACSPDASLTGGLGPSGPGSLVISVFGLPAGAAGSIGTSSAGGYQHGSIGTETLAGLAAGSYTVAALEVTVNGDRYVPTPATQNVTVTPGSAASAAVVYVLVTARLQVTIGGLPAGSAATLSLSGPGGYQHDVSGSALLTGLTPGSYSLHAPSLSSGGDQYQSQPENREVVLPVADTVPVQVSVGYTLATGRLAVEVSGVPTGAAAAIRVTGPGFDQLVTHSDTLIGLLPGTYSVTAGSVATGGYTYLAQPAALSVGITADPIPLRATVVYAVASGGLQVIATGIPPGTDASLSITGPGGFGQTLTGSQLLTDLAPGSYTVSAGNVPALGQLFVPTPSSQTLSVPAGLTPQVASVSYAPAPAGLTVTVSGLPNGVAANITIAGPGGYAMLLTGSQTLGGLVPGGYSITSGTVSGAGISYAPQPAQQSVTLNGGATQVAGVAYAATTGILSLTIAGLPGGTAASVNVSGPGGFLQSVSGSQALQGLLPGNYLVSAGAVSNGGTAYSPTPLSQTVSVSAGATAAGTVTYAVSGGSSLDLTVNGAYLTQATQRYDGSVPLVAGRDAILRVFAVASQANSAQPQVRVRLYQGAALLQTYSIAAPGASVPAAPDESALNKSWNVLVPGALVQPGLKLLADVDPGNGVAEANEGNNQFPVSGTAASVDVRALPTFALRFVPVLQQVNGLQGNVSSGSQDAYLADLRKLLPVGATDIDVRAPYTTSAPALQSANGNGAWNTILSELWALRVSDASSRYYYGVVKVSYGSGVAGLGYVGGGARTALGWDYLPSGTNVMAHEVGHTMSRQHAPCGGPSGTDPSYPYAGGQIGVWGMDVATLTLKPPALTDLMSYCGPNWISDYNWTGMVAYRQSGPSNAPAASAGAAGLLVWGRITPEGVILEPAFAVPAAPGLAPRAGTNRLELLAADGSLLRVVAFEAAELADQPGGDERGFAFVVPLDAPLQGALGGLRVVAGARSATRLIATAAGADPGVIMSRVNPQQVELRWDAARFLMVMVRDAASGQVLSFARGGRARLWATVGDFELQFSDGVRSTVRPARLLR